MESQVLYERMERSLLAWWAGLAQSSVGARIVRFHGITAALFPALEERDVLNNAVACQRTPPDAADIRELAELYRDHGVDLWQLWVREGDSVTSELASVAGLVVDTSTMSMAMDLGPPDLAVSVLSQSPSWAIVRNPDIDDVRDILYHAHTMVPMLHACGASVYLARCNGETAGCAVSFEHDCDCGIYMVETDEHFRRRGLARSLVARALLDAREHGCTSASLQSTAMAESMYRALGFKTLGRYVEWQHRNGLHSFATIT